MKQHDAVLRCDYIKEIDIKGHDYSFDCGNNNLVVHMNIYWGHCYVCRWRAIEQEPKPDLGCCSIVCLPL